MQPWMFISSSGGLVGTGENVSDAIAWAIGTLEGIDVTSIEQEAYEKNEASVVRDGKVLGWVSWVESDDLDE